MWWISWFGFPHWTQKWRFKIDFYSKMNHLRSKIEIPFNDNRMRSRFSRLQSLKWSWTIARSCTISICCNRFEWLMFGSKQPMFGFYWPFSRPKMSDSMVDFSPTRPFWYFRWLLTRRTTFSWKTVLLRASTLTHNLLTLF